MPELLSQNRLHQVFRELGCGIRTLFLLRYISDRPFREEITEGINKVEAWHTFSGWHSFGDTGITTESDPHLVKGSRFFRRVDTAGEVRRGLDSATRISDRVWDRIQKYTRSMAVENVAQAQPSRPCSCRYRAGGTSCLPQLDDLFVDA